VCERLVIVEADLTEADQVLVVSIEYLEAVVLHVFGIVEAERQCVGGPWCDRFRGGKKAIRLTISLIKSGDSLKSFGGYSYYILPLQLINLNV
jgi:hypothetical protein